MSDLDALEPRLLLRGCRSCFFLEYAPTLNGPGGHVDKRPSQSRCRRHLLRSRLVPAKYARPQTADAGRLDHGSAGHVGILSRQGCISLPYIYSGAEPARPARVWALMCFPSGSLGRDQQLAILERWVMFIAGGLRLGRQRIDQACQGPAWTLFASLPPFHP